MTQHVDSYIYEHENKTLVHWSQSTCTLPLTEEMPIKNDYHKL